MNYIHPLAGGIMAAGQAQAHATEDKAKEIRRAQAAARDTARTGDIFEHHVENTEAASAVQDDAKKQQQPKQSGRRRKAPTKEPPRLDVRA